MGWWRRDLTDEKCEKDINLFIKIYQLHRDYIIHEDVLINNRITWMLSIHGFLYASYGLVLAQLINSSQNLDKLCHNVVEYFGLIHGVLFLFIITGIGMGVSCFGLCSIMAAKEATAKVAHVFDKFAEINNHKIEYNKNRTKRHYEVSEKYNFPHVIGGGVVRSVEGGGLASIMVPSTLIIAWLISFCFLSYSIYSTMAEANGYRDGKARLCVSQAGSHK